MFGFRHGEGGTSPRWLIVGTLAVVALFVGADGWRTWKARSNVIEQEQVDTANLARSLAQHAQDMLQSTDTLISGLRAMMETDGFTRHTSDTIHGMLVGHVQAMPIVRDIMAFDKAGHLLVSALREDAVTLNNSGGSVGDRDFFRYHKTHIDRGIHIGDPIRSRVDGVWAIPLSRRLDGPDGEFAGLVLGSLSIDALHEFYGHFDVGAGGSITLETSGGLMITRQPLRAATPGASYMILRSFLNLVRRMPVGNLDFISGFDGVHRVGSYRKVEGFPFIILIANSFDEVLVGWRSDAMTHTVLDACAAAALLVLVMRLARQSDLRRRSEIAAADKDRMVRLLADHSGDVIIKVDPDFRRVYVSPACGRMLGYTADELLHGRAGETAHPEDRPAVAAHMAALAAGTPAPPLGYRIRRKDDAYLWVEAVGSKMDDDDGYVIVLRDITARKHAEAKHKANNELQLLVMRDGLTGISNRRAFDLAIEKEFRRAVRSQTPLALLMIDVDHFKAFNDRYGHPAGDACLRSVAQILDRELRRPGDLVSRYGGEEFAAVLPETDHEGAKLLGEQIRQAICDVAIEHGGSAKSTVTVSVGVAAVWPRHTQLPVELVSLADGALYQAKSLGRNRVCSSPTQVDVGEIDRVPARALEPGLLT